MAWGLEFRRACGVSLGFRRVSYASRTCPLLHHHLLRLDHRLAQKVCDYGGFGRGFALNAPEGRLDQDQWKHRLMRTKHTKTKVRGPSLSW